jgi:hypothetical protein
MALSRLRSSVLIGNGVRSEKIHDVGTVQKLYANYRAIEDVDCQ